MSDCLASLNHRAAAIAQNDARGKVTQFLVEVLGRLRHRNLVTDDGYEFLPTQEQIGERFGLTPVADDVLSHRTAVLELAQEYRPCAYDFCSLLGDGVVRSISPLNFS